MKTKVIIFLKKIVNKQIRIFEKIFSVKKK
jgi:hypothetical protein